MADFLSCHFWHYIVVSLCVGRHGEFYYYPADVVKLFVSKRKKFLFMMLTHSWIIYVERVDAEAIVRRCSVKKAFIETSQNSQENRPQACNFIKKETLTQAFPVNFAKFLRTSFLTLSVAASVDGVFRSCLQVSNSTLSTSCILFVSNSTFGPFQVPFD